MKIRTLDLAWIGFLLLVLAKCLIVPDEPVPWSIIAGWLALLAGAVWAWRATQGGSERLARWSWVYYPLAMNVAFLLLGPTVKRTTHWRADAALQAIDSFFIGENLSLRLQPYVSGVANEVFSFAYLFFMLMLFGGILGYLLNRRYLPGFYSGLFTLYGIGFCGYVLVPAAGPYVAMAEQFAVPIVGGLFTDLNIQMVTQGSNHVDVFPSLHIAISTFVWFFLRRHWPALAWAIAPLVLLLWLSTLYLRYHYLIDLAAGFALAAYCLRVAWREQPNEQPPIAAVSESRVLESP